MNSRDTALKMVEDGLVDVNTMLLACLQYMSGDDVQDMLEVNEFLPEQEEDDDIVIEYEVYDMDDVYLDTVYYVDVMTEEEIIKGLVEHEGYPEGIYLEKVL